MTAWQGATGGHIALRPWLLGICLLLFVLGEVVRGEVVINEIHYRPDVKTEAVEFVELYNGGTNEVDLSGWSMTGGVNFEFAAGTAIAADGYLVVSQDPAALRAKFTVESLGPWQGRLASEGERVNLRNASGRLEDRVEYQIGFPWPTVGEPPGYSIELVHPGMDNSLPGSWRASVRSAMVASTNAASGPVMLVSSGSTWAYFKGTAEASAPLDAWRQPGFDDGSWPRGDAPLGYGEDFLATRLGDMRNNYSSFFLRRHFTVGQLTNVTRLTLGILYDDGFRVWVNGKPLVARNLPGNELPYNATASSSRESYEYEGIEGLDATAYLVAGDNVIAVQVFNNSLGNSSDCFFDLFLQGESSSSGSHGPTPGSRNSVFSEERPPEVLEVKHQPTQPVTGQAVEITAQFANFAWLQSATLEYQLVLPGHYLELSDAAYQTNWTSLTMIDSGTEGDQQAGDGIYTAVLPGSIQGHRRLVRYRITAVATNGLVLRVPYADDPQPNFAYFVYDGVPAWTGAIQPGATPAVVYPVQVMNRVPVYHLISKKDSVERATWIERYGGDLYKWKGTLVHNGRVYDHIGYRTRGGVWRYAMGKNMWKLDFLRGHDFQAWDNYGQKYSVGWTKLNLGACIQQGDYQHRGEQGLFEAVGFRLFNLAGSEAPKTHWIQLRIIDEEAEADPTSQYVGDFWGLYLATEQEDGRFLDEHGLPDGNFYKMEGGTGELNNQGLTGVTDRSDLNQFISSYQNPAISDAWWRTNLDLPRYYNYRSIVECIHHYDIDEGAGKNYFYYLNPETGIWSVHPWDLDLTWANNMYGGGNSPFKNRVLPRTAFKLEYQNRLREIRDLLFNSDQAGQLIEELASIIHDFAGQPDLAAADRAQWDYHPIMISQYVNPSKAGQGRFYQITPTKDFAGMVKLMKDYVVSRGAWVDSSLANDPAIPQTPVMTATGPTNYPVNRLSFHCSDFAGGGGGFAAMKWRLAEIGGGGSDPVISGEPRHYEIQALWESPEITTFNPEILVPPGVAEVGHRYRARVRMQDNTGRWSHWSAPVEFTAGEADQTEGLLAYLRLSEIMVDPGEGSAYEYLEFRNRSTNLVLDLGGATFTEGIEFTFPAGTFMPPGGILLLAKGSANDNFAAFRQYYNLSGEVPIVGPYSGSLDNNGETVTLRSSAAGRVLISCQYGSGGGWPAAAEGGSHSLVVTDEAIILPQEAGALHYPGHWRASTYRGGSPGALDPIVPPTVVLNEIGAHTVYQDPENPSYDSNDWIELYNAGLSPVTLGKDWYLSDDLQDLKKWSLPEVVLAANTWLSFDELTGFHQQATNGFGLDSTGEVVVLSYLPGNSQDRVVDAVVFGAQATNWSYGRYPDGAAFWTFSSPTRDAANASPRPGVWFTEIGYGPKVTVAGDEQRLEFIEICNLSQESVNLGGPEGSWRVRGGISFSFGTNTVLAPDQALVVVAFDPQDAALRQAFASAYGQWDDSVQIQGPFDGRLSDESDRLTLERPLAPETPRSDVTWLVVEEVVYAGSAPWPTGVVGTGRSLQRTARLGPGNNPALWQAQVATPGAVDLPAIDARISFVNPAVFQDGKLRLQIQADQVVPVVLETSENLVDWQMVSTHTLSDQPSTIELELEPALSLRRFYRARMAR